MKPRKIKLFFTPRADSVESNQEGGAMYIETSPNADGYVPNSSLFGPWIDSPTQVKFFVLVAFFRKEKWKINSSEKGKFKRIKKLF